MSMRTYTFSGIGFPIESADPELILAFLRDHPVFSGYEDFLDNLDEISEQTRTNGLFALNDYFEQNIARPIAEIITQEARIYVEGFVDNADCGTEQSVLYTPSYPWQLASNEKERDLTENELYEILIRYADTLGIRSDLVDELTLEYYG